MREPTALEIAAMYHFHNRYMQHRGGAIEFWQTLSPQERDFIRRMVDDIRAASAPKKARQA